jgi:hypothetical protein
MTTEQAAPTAAPALAPVQPGISPDEMGRIHVSSQTVQAPQSEAASILADLVAHKAPPNVIDEWKSQHPELAESTLTPDQQELAAAFPPATPADVDLGFNPDQLATPEGVAAKTQMETWVAASGAPKDMVQPLVNSVNDTAKALATMPANNRAVHAQLETDKAIRMCGGEANYKAQLAEAGAYLRRLDAKSPGVVDFLRAHPEVIDNSAMTQCLLFRMAALDKVRRGG